MSRALGLVLAAPLAEVSSFSQSGVAEPKLPLARLHARIQVRFQDGVRSAEVERVIQEVHKMWGPSSGLPHRLNILQGLMVGATQALGNATVILPEELFNETLELEDSFLEAFTAHEVEHLDCFAQIEGLGKDWKQLVRQFRQAGETMLRDIKDATKAKLPKRDALVKVLEAAANPLYDVQASYTELIGDTVAVLQTKDLGAVSTPFFRSASFRDYGVDRPASPWQWHTDDHATFAPARSFVGGLLKADRSLFDQPRLMCLSVRDASLMEMQLRARNSALMRLTPAPWDDPLPRGVPSITAGEANVRLRGAIAQRLEANRPLDLTWQPEVKERLDEARAHAAELPTRR